MFKHFSSDFAAFMAFCKTVVSANFILVTGPVLSFSFVSNALFTWEQYNPLSVYVTEFVMTIWNPTHGCNSFYAAVIV